MELKIKERVKVKNVIYEVLLKCQEEKEDVKNKKKQKTKRTRLKV